MELGISHTTGYFCLFLINSLFFSVETDFFCCFYETGISVLQNLEIVEPAAIAKP